MNDKTRDTVRIRRAQDTLAKDVETSYLIQVLDAMRISSESGKQVLPAEKILQLLVQEGRGDLGNNGADTSNKRNEARVKELIEKGATYSGASTVTNIEDKQRIATRLNIPFELAWNGTGKVDTNYFKGTKPRSGKDYVKESSLNADAYLDPQNASAFDLIQRGLKGEVTKKERLASLNAFSGAAKAEELGKLGLPDYDAVSTLYAHESLADYSKVRSDMRAQWNKAAKRSLRPEELSAIADGVFAHQLAKQGVDSGLTREYEQRVNYYPDFAAKVGTVAASDTPVPQKEASVLDKILSYFKP